MKKTRRRRLTPTLLKKIVLEEKSRMQEVLETGVEDWEEQVVDKEKAGEDKEGKDEMDCKEE